MDKTNVENVMSIAFELARIREKHGAQSGMYLSEVRALRAEVDRLAAQAAPTEQADLRQLMGMNEAEIDTELIAAGISPDDAVKRADRAIKEALATIRAERRASSGATTAQAVRMLTREELNDVALSDQVGWEPGEYIEAVQRKFCAVNAGRTIPASGEIGSV